MTKKLHGFRAFFLMFFVLLQLFPIDFDDLPSNICDNVNNDPLLLSYLSNSLWPECPYFVQKILGTFAFRISKVQIWIHLPNGILYFLQLHMYFIGVMNPVSLSISQIFRMKTDPICRQNFKIPAIVKLWSSSSVE